MCFKTKRHDCPVCLTPKKGQVKCTICYDTVICSDCMLSMCENGQCDKCPVCRQKNWKQCINKYSITPFSPKKNCMDDKEDIVEEDIPDKINICNIISRYFRFIKKIVLIISTLFMLWVIGLFVTLLIFEIDLEKNLAIVWFPIIVISVILILILCCCWDRIHTCYFS